MSGESAPSVGPVFMDWPILVRRFDQILGDIADGNSDGAGHAAFAGAAEGRGLHGGGGLIEVGIGHDDQMILRPAGGLNALAVAGAGFVNILGDGSRSDEADGLDERMGRAGHRRRLCRRARC